MATSLANYLDVEIPEDACLDSLDVMPALLGQPGARGRENLIQQDNGRNGVEGSFGYRSGKWKLQRKVNRPRQRKGEKGKSAAPAGSQNHPSPVRSGVRSGRIHRFGRTKSRNRRTPKDRTSAFSG